MRHIEFSGRILPGGSIADKTNRYSLLSGRWGRGGLAGFPGDPRAEGGHYRASRRARASPRSYLSAVKEPKFFLTDGPPPDRGGSGDAQTYREHIWRRADYEALFRAAPAGALRGESTPFYLYDRAAQRRIRALIPAARLIVSLRDPVERAHSNWTHLWSAGREPVGDFLRACAEEDRRVTEGWSAFWHYIRLGRYGEQLDHLLGLFPRDQVMIFRYRRLLDEPAQVLDDICAFLDVEQGVVSEVPRENVTAHPRRSLAHGALSRTLRGTEALGRRLPGTAGTTVTARLERILQREARPRQPLTWQERQALLPARQGSGACPLLVSDCYRGAHQRAVLGP